MLYSPQSGELAAALASLTEMLNQNPHMAAACGCGLVPWQHPTDAPVIRKHNVEVSLIIVHSIYIYFIP